VIDKMVEAAKVGLHLSSRVIEVRVADDGGIKVLWVEGGIENQIYEVFSVCCVIPSSPPSPLAISFLSCHLILF
jgi:hypothetical protein